MVVILFEDAGWAPAVPLFPALSRAFLLSPALPRLHGRGHPLCSEVPSLAGLLCLHLTRSSPLVLAQWWVCNQHHPVPLHTPNSPSAVCPQEPPSVPTVVSYHLRPSLPQPPPSVSFRFYACLPQGPALSCPLPLPAWFPPSCSAASCVWETALLGWASCFLLCLPCGSRPCPIPAQFWRKLGTNGPPSLAIWPHPTEESLSCCPRKAFALSDKET